MDLNLTPEILILAKASPWVPLAWLVIRQLGALLSPFASILAIRLARNDKERATFLEHRRIECRPPVWWSRHKGDDGNQGKRTRSRKSGDEGHKRGTTREN